MFVLRNCTSQEKPRASIAIVHDHNNNNCNQRNNHTEANMQRQ